jgi:hypothetical protein
MVKGKKYGAFFFLMHFYHLETFTEQWNGRRTFVLLIVLVDFLLLNFVRDLNFYGAVEIDYMIMVLCRI